MDLGVSVFVCFSWDQVHTVHNTHDKSGEDGLNRVYRHFIGKTDTKNDISFVVGAWKVLLEQNAFDGMENINIWSDGEPKHFKISTNMRFVVTLQKARTDINWSYNFFSAYHECSVCDAAASHTKKAVITSQMDTSIAIKSPEEVITKIAALKTMWQIK